jgi:Protein of unknown function (DUF2493).
LQTTSASDRSCRLSSPVRGGSSTVSLFSDEDRVERVGAILEAVPWPVDEVVSGTARGADTAGEAWAEHHGVPVERFPADWDEHGKSAGPIRNQEMADYADAVVAIWDGKSSGTHNMIRTGREDLGDDRVFVYEYR